MFEQLHGMIAANCIMLFWVMLALIIVMLWYHFYGMSEGVTAGGPQWVGDQGYFSGGRQEAFQRTLGGLEHMAGAPSVTAQLNSEKQQALMHQLGCSANPPADSPEASAYAFLQGVAAEGPGENFTMRRPERMASGLNDNKLSAIMTGIKN